MLKQKLCGFFVLVLALPCGARVAQAQDSLRHNSGQPYLAPEETVKRFQLHD